MWFWKHSMSVFPKHFPGIYFFFLKKFFLKKWNCSNLKLSQIKKKNIYKSVNCEASYSASPSAVENCFFPNFLVTPWSDSYYFFPLSLPVSFNKTFPLLMLLKFCIRQFSSTLTTPYCPYSLLVSCIL